MRTQEQFLRGIHERAATLRRAQERRRTAACSALCVVLTVLLSLETVTPHVPGAGALTGASLLAAETGGYVLTAVIAFMAGVAITVLLRRGLEKRKTKGESSALTEGK